MIDRTNGWRYNQKAKIRQKLHLKAENKFIKLYNRSVVYAKDYRWYKKWLDPEYVERMHQETIRTTLRNEGKWRMAGERNHWGCGCHFCMKWAFNKDNEEERMNWELKMYTMYGEDFL